MEDTPKTYLQALALTAKKYVGVIEVGGDNRGPEVEAFQRAYDNVANGEPWCCSFLMYCIDEVERVHGIRAKVFRTEHVMSLWSYTHPRMRRAAPVVGTAAVWRKAGTEQGHVEIVTGVPKPTEFLSVGGNTGPGPGVERDGDGVWEKIHRFGGKVASDAKFKLLGFVDPFG